jgi:hypothetical protein
VHGLVGFVSLSVNVKKRQANLARHGLWVSRFDLAAEPQIQEEDSLANQVLILVIGYIAQ